MFQPGEEGWDGAGVMLEEGVLDAAGRRVDAAYGMHVFSSMFPPSQFVSRPGHAAGGLARPLRDRARRRAATAPRRTAPATRSPRWRR